MQHAPPVDADGFSRILVNNALAPVDRAILHELDLFKHGAASFG